MPKNPKISIKAAKISLALPIPGASNITSVVQAPTVPIRVTRSTPTLPSKVKSSAPVSRGLNGVAAGEASAAVPAQGQPQSSNESRALITPPPAKKARDSVLPVLETAPAMPVNLLKRALFDSSPRSNPRTPPSLNPGAAVFVPLGAPPRAPEAQVPPQEPPQDAVPLSPSAPAAAKTKAKRQKMVRTAKAVGEPYPEPAAFSGFIGPRELTSAERATRINNVPTTLREVAGAAASRHARGQPQPALLKATREEYENMSFAERYHFVVVDTSEEELTSEPDEDCAPNSTGCPTATQKVRIPVHLAPDCEWTDEQILAAHDRQRAAAKAGSFCSTGSAKTRVPSYIPVTSQTDNQGHSSLNHQRPVNECASEGYSCNLLIRPVRGVVGACLFTALAQSLEHILTHDVSAFSMMFNRTVRDALKYLCRPEHMRAVICDHLMSDRARVPLSALGGLSFIQAVQHDYINGDSVITEVDAAGNSTAQCIHSYDQYVSTMSKATAYGDEICFSAFSDLFSLRTIVMDTVQFYKDSDGEDVRHAPLRVDIYPQATTTEDIDRCTEADDWSPSPRLLCSRMPVILVKNGLHFDWAYAESDTWRTGAVFPAEDSERLSCVTRLRICELFNPHQLDYAPAGRYGVVQATPDARIRPLPQQRIRDFGYSMRRREQVLAALESDRIDGDVSTSEIVRLYEAGGERVHAGSLPVLVRILRASRTGNSRNGASNSNPGPAPTPTNVQHSVHAHTEECLHFDNQPAQPGKRARQGAEKRASTARDWQMFRQQRESEALNAHQHELTIPLVIATPLIDSAAHSLCMLTGIPRPRAQALLTQKLDIWVQDNAVMDPERLLLVREDHHARDVLAMELLKDAYKSHTAKPAPSIDDSLPATGAAQPSTTATDAPKVHEVTDSAAAFIEANLGKGTRVMTVPEIAIAQANLAVANTPGALSDIVPKNLAKYWEFHQDFTFSTPRDNMPQDKYLARIRRLAADALHESAQSACKKAIAAREMTSTPTSPPLAVPCPPTAAGVSSMHAATGFVTPRTSGAVAGVSHPHAHASPAVKLARDRETASAKPATNQTLVVFEQVKPLMWKQGPEAESKGFVWSTYTSIKTSWELCNNDRSKPYRSFKTFVDPRFIQTVCRETATDRANWELISDAELITKIEDKLRPKDSTSFFLRMKALRISTDPSFTLGQRYRVFADAFMSAVNDAQEAGTPIAEEAVKLSFRLACNGNALLQMWLGAIKWSTLDAAHCLLIEELRKMECVELYQSLNMLGQTQLMPVPGGHPTAPLPASVQHYQPTVQQPAHLQHYQPAAPLPAPVQQYQPAAQPRAPFQHYQPAIPRHDAAPPLHQPMQAAPLQAAHAHQGAQHQHQAAPQDPAHQHQNRSDRHRNRPQNGNMNAVLNQILARCNRLEAQPQQAAPAAQPAPFPQHDANMNQLMARLDRFEDRALQMQQPQAQVNAADVRYGQPRAPPPARAGLDHRGPNWHVEAGSMTCRFHPCTSVFCQGCGTHGHSDADCRRRNHPEWNHTGYYCDRHPGRGPLSYVGPAQPAHPNPPPHQQHNIPPPPVPPFPTPHTMNGTPAAQRFTPVARSNVASQALPEGPSAEQQQ